MVSHNANHCSFGFCWIIESNTPFKYGEGIYGAGTLAYLFSNNFPILSIEAETNYADIHLYNRSLNPESGSGPHRIGDIICVDGEVEICTFGGSPGTFEVLAHSDGTTGGTDSAGTGKQYIEMTVNGITYKILHDGIIS